MLTWDALVLATGARPRNLPFTAPEGVHTLRTLADARALRASLVAGARLAVVGGGFIGAEVASTAVALGLDVTLIEALPVPFERTLGAEVGQMLAERYRSYGVDVRLATGVVGFGAGSDGGVRAARLTDGTEVPCDLALVGIGIEPARELLPHPLAGHPIYPCGDVTGNGGHWTSAAAQGTAVARRILGLPIEPPKPAFFWSDQFGLRLQLVGETAPTGSVSLDGTPDSYLARYHDGEGVDRSRTLRLPDGRRRGAQARHGRAVAGDWGATPAGRVRARVRADADRLRAAAAGDRVGGVRRRGTDLPAHERARGGWAERGRSRQPAPGHQLRDHAGCSR